MSGENELCRSIARMLQLCLASVFLGLVSRLGLGLNLGAINFGREALSIP